MSHKLCVLCLRWCEASSTRSSLHLVMSGLTQGEAKTDEMDAVAGRHHEPVAGTGEFNGLIPTATPENFELALTRPRGIGYCLGGIRSEPIAAPFPHVAVH